MRRAAAFAAGAVLFASAALAGTLWSAPWLLGVGTATAEDLRTVSNRLAGKLPVMVDAETRLEGAEAGTGLEQVFRFRLVNKDIADFDAAATRARLGDRARRGICTDATMAPLIQRGVKVTYLYQDRAGNEALRFSVQPLDCLWSRVQRAVGA